MRRDRVIPLLSTIIVLAVTGTAAASASSQHSRAPRSAAAASSVNFTSLRSSVLRVTGGGHHLHLSVGATKASQGHPGATVTLSTGKAYLIGETHSWSFTLKPGALAYSAKTGRGHLKSGTSLKSYGLVDVSFKKTSQKKGPCLGTGTQTTVAGRLSGKVFFNTHTGSHGWGTVGSRKHKVTFHGKSFITLLGQGCGFGGGGSASCVTETTWNGPAGTTSATENTGWFGIISKTGHHTASTIEVTSSSSLSKPAGANEQAELIAKEPAPTLHAGAGSLDIKTSGKAITGSASIQNTTATTSSYPCKQGGHTKHEKVKTYTGTWSGNSLTAHFSATGKQTAPASGSASFATYSP